MSSSNASPKTDFPMNTGEHRNLRQLSDRIGMNANGGPAAVGRAVAKSLMINLVLVHVISAFTGVGRYGTNNLQLPIGG